MGNAPPYSYGYQVPFAAAPVDIVVSAAAMDGGDGGWPVAWGSPATTASQLFLAIDEDQIRDSERRHTTEQVAYIAFGAPLLVQ